MTKITTGQGIYPNLAIRYSSFTFQEECLISRLQQQSFAPQQVLKIYLAFATPVFKGCRLSAVEPGRERRESVYTRFVSLPMRSACFKTYTHTSSRGHPGSKNRYAFQVPKHQSYINSRLSIRTKFPSNW